MKTHCEHSDSTKWHRFLSVMLYRSHWARTSTEARVKTGEEVVGTALMLMV